ncbi:MAG: zf-HC2 domain-containing protein [Pseudomonadota bacterium]
MTDRDDIDELLSGYLDGELTQQEHQRVRLRCETDPAYREKLEELRALRERVGNMSFGTHDANQWRESMNDLPTQTTRGLGWLLLIGGALIAAGFAVFLFFSNVNGLSLIERLIVGGIYGGLLLLFISVLRQRLIERKKDKYKDVEI